MKELKSKIILSTDNDSKSLFEKNLSIKISAQSKLVEYMNRFIKTDEKEAFKGDVKDYFKQALEEKYKKDFPPYVILDKIFDLVGVSFETFDLLYQKYNHTEVEGFDPFTREAPEKDFNTYIENEEQEFRYNETSILINSLNSFLEEMEKGIHPRGFVARTLRVVSYCATENKFKINENYVLRGLK